jgi:hypothetical protein
LDTTSSFSFLIESKNSLKIRQVIKIRSAVSKVNKKLNVRNPLIYLTILIPSGKQNSGNWVKFILSARADKYF